MMTAVQKRMASSFYWLVGCTFAFAGMAVGFITGLFLSGYKTAMKIHQDSVDVWDSRYNDHL